MAHLTRQAVERDRQEAAYLVRQAPYDLVLALLPVLRMEVAPAQSPFAPHQPVVLRIAGGSAVAK